MKRELPPTAGLPLQWRDFTGAFSFFAKDSGAFEARLADYLEQPELDVFSSGTLCLSIAFTVLKQLTGRSRVIVPAYTCPLVAIAARSAGVELVLCDIQPHRCDLDLKMLESICDRSIAAVLPTDIAGIPVNVLEVREIAAAAGAYVIEDAAQALGARAGGKPVGADADIAFWSLAVGKGLSLYDGGIIAAKDAELREHLRTAASRLVKRRPLMNLRRFVELLGLTCLYNPSGLYWAYGLQLRRCLSRGDLKGAVGERFGLDIPSYRFDRLRKLIGLEAFSRLPAFVEDNRRRALSRAASIERESCFQVLSESEGDEGSWPFILLLADSEEQRDLVMQRLWASGLGVTRLFIHELSGYDYLKDLVPRQSLPNAAAFASRTFSITNSHWLTDDEFEKLLACLRAVAGVRGAAV